MRLPRPRGLRGQLLLLLLGSLVLTHLASIALFFDERRLAVRAALGEELAGRAANVVFLIEASPPDLHEGILQAAGSPFVRFSIEAEPAVAEAGTRRARLIARQIERLLGEDRARDVRVRIDRLEDRTGPKGPSARARGAEHRHDDRDDWRERRSPRRMGPPAHGLTVAIGLEETRWLNVETVFSRPPVQWAWPSVVSLWLMALAILLVVWFAVRSIARPMRALARAADRFGRGGEAVPVPLEGPSEVRVVTEAFNTMQERIGRFVRERTEMLAALGHDLRSPLTAMRLRAELIDDEETRDRLTASIEEMQTMVEATLAYAKGIADHEAMATVDLAEIVRDVADEVAAGGGTVEIDATGPTEASVRPTALKRALRNVVENAVRYGGSAAVRLERDGGDVVLVVEDEGPGIEESALERVFEPFTRLESSRSRETGGTGLGLAIARTIVRAHGGEITLANRPEGGLRATLRLPTGVR